MSKESDNIDVNEIRKEVEYIDAVKEIRYKLLSLNEDIANVLLATLVASDAQLLEDKKPEIKGKIRADIQILESVLRKLDEVKR